MKLLAKLLTIIILLTVANIATSEDVPPKQCANKSYKTPVLDNCTDIQRSVQIVTGGKDGAYLDLVNNIARTEDELRVVPLITRGSRQNIEYLLWLKGVDLALVQADILESVLKNPEKYEVPNNIGSSINLVAKVFEENIYLIKTTEQPIESVAIIGGEESGSYHTYTFFKDFNDFHIPNGVDEVFRFTDRDDAYMEMQAGALDAIFFVVRKSADDIRAEIANYFERDKYSFAELEPDGYLYPENKDGLRTVDTLLISVNVADSYRYENICEFNDIVRSLQKQQEFKEYDIEFDKRTDMAKLEVLSCY